MTRKQKDMILKQALLSPLNKHPVTVQNYAEPQIIVYEILQSLPEIEQPEFPWETAFIYVTFWISMIMMALSFWGGLAILLLLRGI